MLKVHLQPRSGGRRRWWQVRPPRVLAMFSFRYDAHLVPDMLDNLAPMIDGWVSWDDRKSSDLITNEIDLRCLLLDAAFEAGADWVLRVDPDERFESGVADRMDTLTAVKLPVVWMFRLRELYSPDRYRVDGVWGNKQQGRLFPVWKSLVPAAERGRFPQQRFHSPFVPKGFPQIQTGLNLYHLKMIEPRRRVLRRELYNALDPDRRYQKIGYDYLVDETGARFETIPAGRGYEPPHHDDGGLWMAELPAPRT